MPEKILPSLLVEKTIELYHQLPREIKAKQVSIDTGLSATWLSSFVNRRLNYPQVGKVEKLYEYLNKAPLKV